MYREPVIRRPVKIGGRSFSAQRSTAARMSLATYLLLCGVLFISSREEDADALPPEEDLAAAGIIVPKERLPRGQQALYGGEPVAPYNSRAEIAAMAQEANSSGNAAIAAAAIALGIESNDELIQICALRSAVDFFQREQLAISERMIRLLSIARDPLTLELMRILSARVFSWPLEEPEPHSGRAGDAKRPGLIAVHGTVLPFSQSSKPGDWFIPRKGALFRHISNFRPDIYSGADYFRWEGGYTDWARDIASERLAEWIDARGLQGSDVVAHSHGCNVVMRSMEKGATYGKVVFMSCPVHWHKYSLPPDAQKNAVSVRAKLDIVILMDRGSQRFPAGTIREHLLPCWYYGHWRALSPATWRRERLDSYL